jgi:hypothetical protein
LGKVRTTGRIAILLHAIHDEILFEDIPAEEKRILDLGPVI